MGGDFHAGSVNVLYGSAAGLTDLRDQLWHQDVRGVEGDSGDDDEFGSALAAADFGSIAHQDLAIGVPGEDVGGDNEAGAVAVLYGSPAGLAIAGDQLWTQDSSGVNDAAEQGDHFGQALAAADFGKGATDDLAIGVPAEGIGGVTTAGAVNVLYGTSGGLSSAGDQLWHQDRVGIVDTAEEGDGFGFSLAAGLLGNGGRSDLAVGVFSEDVSGVTDAGAVAVLYGFFTDGLRVTGNQLLTQDSPGVAGDGAEVNDHLGFALTVGSFGNGSPSDLAATAWFESVGAVGATGAVTVLYGTPTGPTGTGSQFWHQNRPGVQEVAEYGDSFGSALG